MPSRGELEQRVRELLWAADAPLSVAAVHAQLSAERELAYTTVMTVLDRLAKKGMATRELVGRAWEYRPTQSQAASLAAEIDRLLSRAAPDVRAEALRRVLANEETVDGEAG